jgi:ribosome biogenesis GTPase
MKVGSVRAGDDRGMHITSHRELFLLPGGGVVIDNPGIRELQMWVDQDTLENTFSDIKGISAKCRFDNCQHTNEPGCAVREALEKDELDSKRFQNYIKLKKEIRYLATRKEKVKSRNEKIITEKNISKLSKQIKKHSRKYEF